MSRTEKECYDAFQSLEYEVNTEDPVTGSAHCALCAYWSKELNKLNLKGYQASNRGGFVDVERVSENQVKLSGQAITVFQGRMKIA
ncbi:PhzF family phenazine biosynthesis protein [Vibrio metschnikovii]|uniref:PhzF family phenazine biosynthesis protein n=1 Tax=Vibrio metschnikovii TaxID=28172 RepID=UPI0039F1CC16